MGGAPSGGTVSTVIPAHNEERVLPRLLAGLTDSARPGEFDVVVVANGCTDATADSARREPGVRVIETPVAAKGHALDLGDQAVSTFPRLYVDADIEIGAADVRSLADAVRRPGILAAGPVRGLPMAGVSVGVRWYYDVWQRLPGSADELYGRGVIAVSEDGHARLAGWADVMSDDLLTAMSFRAVGDRRRTGCHLGHPAAAHLRRSRTPSDAGDHGKRHAGDVVACATAATAADRARRSCRSRTRRAVAGAEGGGVRGDGACRPDPGAPGGSSR